MTRQMKKQTLMLLCTLLALLLSVACLVGFAAPASALRVETQFCVVPGFDEDTGQCCIIESIEAVYDCQDDQWVDVQSLCSATEVGGNYIYAYAPSNAYATRYKIGWDFSSPYSYGYSPDQFIFEVGMHEECRVLFMFEDSDNGVTALMGWYGGEGDAFYDPFTYRDFSFSQNDVCVQFDNLVPAVYASWNEMYKQFDNCYILCVNELYDDAGETVTHFFEVGEIAVEGIYPDQPNELTVVVAGAQAVYGGPGTTIELVNEEFLLEYDTQSMYKIRLQSNAFGYGGMKTGTLDVTEYKMISSYTDMEIVVRRLADDFNPGLPGYCGGKFTIKLTPVQVDDSNSPICNITVSVSPDSSSSFAGCEFSDLAITIEKCAPVQVLGSHVLYSEHDNEFQTFENTFTFYENCPLQCFNVPITRGSPNMGFYLPVGIDALGWAFYDENNQYVCDVTNGMLYTADLQGLTIKARYSPEPQYFFASRGVNVGNIGPTNSIDNLAGTIVGCGATLLHDADVFYYWGTELKSEEYKTTYSFKITLDCNDVYYQRNNLAAISHEFIISPPVNAGDFEVTEYLTFENEYGQFGAAFKFEGWINTGVVIRRISTTTMAGYKPFQMNNYTFTISLGPVYNANTGHPAYSNTSGFSSNHYFLSDISRELLLEGGCYFTWATNLDFAAVRDFPYIDITFSCPELYVYENTRQGRMRRGQISNFTKVCRLNLSEWIVERQLPTAATVVSVPFSATDNNNHTIHGQLSFRLGLSLNYLTVCNALCIADDDSMPFGFESHNLAISLTQPIVVHFNDFDFNQMAAYERVSHGYVPGTTLSSWDDWQTYLGTVWRYIDADNNYVQVSGDTIVDGTFEELTAYYDWETAVRLAYNSGIEFADGRVNVDSESYVAGFDAAYDVAYDDGVHQGYSEGHSDGYAEGADYGRLFGYEEGYNAGVAVSYDEGYSAGKTDGIEIGRERGYNEGASAGFEEGYRQGNEYGYAAGKTDGRVEGKAEGIEIGRERGYNEGASAGFEEGYRQGNEYGYAAGKTDGRVEANGEVNEESASFSAGYDKGFREGYYSENPPVSEAETPAEDSQEPDSENPPAPDENNSGSDEGNKETSEENDNASDNKLWVLGLCISIAVLLLIAAIICIVVIAKKRQRR